MRFLLFSAFVEVLKCLFVGFNILDGEVIPRSSF